MATFRFRFSQWYRAAGLPFGITPTTTRVEVGGGQLLVRFGPWKVRTTARNVAGSEVTGPYSAWKTIGPAHLSLADRGLTCATNGQRGLCIRFFEPVAGIEPFGRIRHPGLTVTVDDIDGLAAALDAASGRP
ncbi:MAG: hypothetical protein M3N52_13635 [Actinomycetota bacterium]|nr:hypothetical protein [Actinomycetota bacterium]